MLFGFTGLGSNEVSHGQSEYATRFADSPPRRHTSLMVSFRAATRDDRSAIAEICQTASHTHPDRYSEHWGRWGDFGVIAETGTDPCGAAWARLFRWDDLRDPSSRAEFPEVAIALDPPYRGQGLGSALLRELVVAAHELGYLALDLSVDRSNLAAIAVYTKLGFKRIDGDTRLLMRAVLNEGRGACLSPLEPSF